jgi:hypothetical protein
MKQDQNPETPNICNNCVKPEKKPVDEISILIKCDSATQKMIEEICINQGISFSDYFLSLHRINQRCDFLEPKLTVTNALPKELEPLITNAKLPEGFGEIEIPSDEPLITKELADPPKKRGRPFKNH